MDVFCVENFQKGSKIPKCDTLFFKGFRHTFDLYSASSKQTVQKLQTKRSFAGSLVLIDNYYRRLIILIILTEILDRSLMLVVGFIVKSWNKAMETSLGESGC